MQNCLTVLSTTDLSRDIELRRHGYTLNCLGCDAAARL